MEDYPYAKPFKDRHGHIRWRFRFKGKDKYLPSEPGTPAFHEAYLAAVEGRPPRKAKVHRLPTAAQPETFRAAWRLVLKSPEWKGLDDATVSKNTRLAHEFLDLRVDPDAPDMWGDMRVADLRRRHVRAILADFSETPHKAKHLLTTIRKMLGEALDQDWIEHDPTHKLKWRPAYGGWRAWTLSERKKFEERWPVGTMPRAAYALALWTGARRSEVAAQVWSDVDFDASRITVRQIKGDGKVLRLLLLPMLADAIRDVPKRADTILSTEYGQPFSEKSLTGMMAHWTKLAGMGSGCTFHGLRKTLGKYLAEEGATAKQAAGILGHDDLDHVELYSREAEQERLAVAGLERLIQRYG
jgi:integrase